jgi:hypothetical protein
MNAFPYPTTCEVIRLIAPAVGTVIGLLPCYAERLV